MKDKGFVHRLFSYIKPKGLFIKLFYLKLTNVMSKDI
jgi:hypothetical protein